MSFDPTIGFYFTSQQSLSSLLFNNINEESLTSMYHLTYSPKIDTYYRFNYLRSASHLSGSQVTYLIQDVDSMTIPIGSHKMLISGYEIKNRRQSIFKREMVSSSTQNKISLISNLISSLSRSARKENPDIFVPDVTFQSTEESQLIIEKRTGRIISEDYTRDHFNNILRSMDLTDEMLVTMFYYTVDNEGKTVWHLKNDGTLTDTKDYYRSWLKAIRNSISNPSEEFNHYFSKFDYLIQPSFEFSSGKKFIVEKDPSNPQDYIFNDPYLAKLVDKALIESFGYEAFMLLSNGFLTFSPKDEGYDCFIRTHFRSKNDQIKSEWYKRHRNLGLGSLIERRDDSFLFYSSQISGYTFNTGFWASMVLLGQRRNIEVVYIKNNKITKIEESNILTYPSSPFIRKLYYGHTNIRYSHVTNRRFIGQFLNDFYSVYVPSLKIMKNIYRGTEQKIIEGRQILISLFRDMFREKISHISISKLFPNKDLNEKYSKDVVVDYMTLLFMRYMYKIIQKEGNINRDYITSIKEAIIKGYGTIEMGSSYSEQNPLFDATDGKGLEIKIDLSKFDESLLAKIIWTLDFDGSIEIAQFKEVKKIKNVNGKICEPIIHMYRTLLNILSSIEDHSRFFASFYIPGMGGMSDGTSLFNKFNHKYDVDSNRIEINLDDPDYKLKIASVIYYMVKYNAIISVKAGYYNSRKNVLYMSQTEILDEGYMKQAFYDKSKNIGGNLVTDALIYLSWNNQYKSGTFTLQNTFPIHDFADGDEFDKYFMNIINTRTGENFIRKPEDLHQLV